MPSTVTTESGMVFKQALLVIQHGSAPELRAAGWSETLVSLLEPPAGGTMAAALTAATAAAVGHAVEMASTVVAEIAEDGDEPAPFSVVTQELTTPTRGVAIRLQPRGRPETLLLFQLWEVVVPAEQPLLPFDSDFFG